jgi:tRNA-2-methylthio-N6-dimethylallyladenosine synthase
MFSKRSGTSAAELPDQIPLEVKRERLSRLMEVQNRKSLEWRQSLVGKDVEVLVEGTSKKNASRLTGRTRGNDIVVFEDPGQGSLAMSQSESDLVGKLVQIRVERAKSWTLFGRLV